MTGKERIGNILKRKKGDRIGVYEHFWNDTRTKWEKTGVIKPGQFFSERFGHDLELAWVFNVIADINFEPVILEETDSTFLKLDGNSAKLRFHKLHETTPEHVDFLIKASQGYREHIRHFLVASEERIDFETYLKTKTMCERDNRFFMWSGVAPFECMHLLCGHENLLVGMALEPEWILEMSMDYAKLTIELQEILFSKHGKPDGIYYYEDLGFKFRPFMSPQMYRELLFPSHKYLFDYAKSCNLPVMMHSCGFVEPLLPHIVEAGIDALDVMENKAGMDPIRIFKDYGERLSFMGGVDVRALYSNDRAVIDAELEAKIPILKQNYGYILHSDHSIPVTVELETYEYFMKKGLELGRY